MARFCKEAKQKVIYPVILAVALKKAPTINELAAIKADAAKGKTVFMNTCSVCHMVEQKEKILVLSLTEIGSKYAKDGLLRCHCSSF